MGGAPGEDVYRGSEEPTCAPQTCYEACEAHRVQLHVGCVNKSGLGLSDSKS